MNTLPMESFNIQRAIGVTTTASVSGVSTIATFTPHGVPFLWGTGDIITPSSAGFALTAFDAEEYDLFGRDVAVGCGKIVIGAENGGGSDPSGGSYGSAYIYDLDGTNVIKIMADSATRSGYDNFGLAIDVGCGRIVVGAYDSDYTAPNVNTGVGGGAVYVFDLDGNQLGIVTASDAEYNDHYGYSVAVGHNKIVVGADNESSVDTYAGAAYIYDLDGTNEIKLTPPPMNNNIGVNYPYGPRYDSFGHSVAIGCGRIVVGAPFSDVLLPGETIGSSNSGRVYIYDLDGNLITHLNTGYWNDWIDYSTSARFGYSVAVGDGLIVVGAISAYGSNQGGIYVYDIDGNPLFAANKNTFGVGRNFNDDFGTSVAVGHGRIVVSAPGDDGIINDNWRPGAVYILDYFGNLIERILAPDATRSENFGQHLAMGCGKIILSEHAWDFYTGGVSPVAQILNGGRAWIRNTPHVYTAYDLFDMENGD